MMTRAFALSLGLLLVAAGAHAAEPPLPPPPTRWVTDTVGFISPMARSRLDARLEAYQRATGHQVVVWIGNSIEGGDLADWSVRTFENWKVGRKGIDDGVAVFILAADKKIDIEVGYGLEGQVTDAKARRAIDEMVERIRLGDRDGAVAVGVESILTAIEGKPVPGADDAVGQYGPQKRQPRPVSLGQKIIFAILGLAFLVFFITNPRLAMLMLWSVMARGGGGGFGGGGGGFEGGGGRSGGGGARGGW